MSDTSFLLEFEGLSAADANQLIPSLCTVLHRVSPDIKVEQRRDSETAMDFGTAVALILGTEAAIAVAQGIANWMAKHNISKVAVKTEKGEIVAENLTSRDAVRMAELLAKKR